MRIHLPSNQACEELNRARFDTGHRHLRWKQSFGGQGELGTKVISELIGLGFGMWLQVAPSHLCLRV